ncbi:MAG: sulfurtransferase TusA family protein [Geminicoccaceae bacterium]|nr:sulfurtransferase TusA family protein [Geminicoccaceae bacterium]MCS7268790.1 sulfurtransferase TusA family protein [Geminicoccaceae bacterium]MCX7630883.1 sulfurtransferase TusA family protein [Geminicoccaceae bacterium]MDW8125877.1 sulfurtransferase TusA family protein [Geminicoccaceae bacterium]MDW8340510.1 sulfurtransferase TusA family protein [Geminicoccaceae bacterium]
MDGSQTTHELDITAEVCPMTFVRTKLRLERMNEGEILRIRLRDGEPLVNVPRALADHGHEILRLEPLGQSLWLLEVRKGGRSSR